MRTSGSRPRAPRDLKAGATAGARRVAARPWRDRKGLCAGVGARRDRRGAGARANVDLQGRNLPRPNGNGQALWELPTARTPTRSSRTIEAEELARVAVPARRDRPELALGNIIAGDDHPLRVVQRRRDRAGKAAAARPRHHELLAASRRGQPGAPRRGASLPPPIGPHRGSSANRALRGLPRRCDRRVILTRLRPGVARVSAERARAPRSPARPPSSTRPGMELSATQAVPTRTPAVMKAADQPRRTRAGSA